MIGMERLASLQKSVEIVLSEDVPGDLVECGVWRGGACILMRAVLTVYGDEKRHVWVADSFAGVPPPDSKNYAADKDLRRDLQADVLAVPESTVRATLNVTAYWIIVSPSSKDGSKILFQLHQLTVSRSFDLTVISTNAIKSLKRCIHVSR